MELVSNYMRDDTLRHALNDLTKKTFGFERDGFMCGRAIRWSRRLQAVLFRGTA